MTGTAERKLTTIFCADVAGYSAMMDRDEDGTLSMLKDYRRRMRALIGRHRGHVISTAGDGLLAEFASPVESVRCATEVQRELGSCNANHPPERQMRFRIGINLGDVMVDDGDLFGEGVNIAARLQSLAQPGGILIASTVFDQVKSKLPVRFDFMGEQHVKNIAEGIPTYRVLIDAPDASAETEDAAWQDFVPEGEEEELASRAFDTNATFGSTTPEPPASPSPTEQGSEGTWHRDGSQWPGHQLLERFEGLVGRFVGRTENDDARTLARRSGLLGLVLAAVGVVTPLDFLVWVGIVAAFAGAQVAISKAGWSRKQALRARLLALIPFLAAVNLASSPGQWWFVLPSVILGVIAVLIGDGPKPWGRSRPSG